MKSNTFLIIVVSCALLCAACTTEVDYNRYEDRYQSVWGDPGALNTLREDVTRELKRHPDDERLLRLRATISNALGDLADGEADMIRLAELFPTSPYYRLSRCVAMEIRHGYSADVLQCYSGVMSVYEKALNPDTLAYDPGYVVVALMAEAPGAEELRMRFLSKAGDDPDHAYPKRLLEHFDRRYVTGEATPPAELLFPEKTISQ